MAHAPFPHLVVRGGPAQRGRQYGELAKERIQRSLAVYRQRFQESAGLQWAEARRLARERYLPSIEAHFPAGAEEMAGIARGAGCELDEVVALNARYELVRAYTPECTSAVCLPEATGGPVLHGQNWDYHVSVLETAVVLEIHPDDGPAMIMLAEAGQLGRNGMSAAGLAVTANNLKSALDRPGKGMPLSLFRRMFLQSPSYGLGLARLMQAPRHVSNNLTVSTAEGDAINFEITPEYTLELYPERGIITHSNHFKAAGAPRDLGKQVGHTLFRDRRVRQRLMARHGRIGVQDLIDAFSDHLSYPESVCTHPRPGGTAITAACIVMNVTEATYTICAGPPCQGVFQTYRLHRTPAQAASDS